MSDRRSPLPISWPFVSVTAVFITCLITANIISVKLIEVGPWVLPAGVVIFPIAYIAGDILTEVYGFDAARRVIWLGFGCNALAVGAIVLAGQIPAPPFWTAGDAYRQILGFTSRLLAASIAAYLVGEFANAMILARLKVLTRGRHLWIRTTASTFVGQGLDSAVFLTIAFAGVSGVGLGAIRELIITQWLFKTAYEALATPLTYVVVNYLKRIEGLDTFDRQTNFSPLAIAGSRGGGQP
jgi:uncharacterized integral membrane protein (TIGR00697 family)